MLRYSKCIQKILKYLPHVTYQHQEHWSTSKQGKLHKKRNTSASTIILTIYKVQRFELNRRKWCCTSNYKVSNQKHLMRKCTMRLWGQEIELQDFIFKMYELPDLSNLLMEMIRWSESIKPLLERHSGPMVKRNCNIVFSSKIMFYSDTILASHNYDNCSLMLNKPTPVGFTRNHHSSIHHSSYMRITRE